MTLAKDDFIELAYTGKLADTDEVFDTTDELVAKKAAIFDPGRTFKPVNIQLGKRQVIPGLDDDLIGKEVGTDYTISVKTENAFGKRNAKMIQLISTGKFRSQNIRPTPGLTVNIDGIQGIVRTVTGGRTIVDFNHPLSGKDVIYTVKVIRKVDDPKEQIESIIAISGIPATVAVEDGKATITVEQELPKEFLDSLEKHVKEAIKSITDVSVVVSKTKKSNSTI